MVGLSHKTKSISRRRTFDGHYNDQLLVRFLSDTRILKIFRGVAQRLPFLYADGKNILRMFIEFFSNAL
jgi:hypothetical protein